MSALTLIPLTRSWPAYVPAMLAFSSAAVSLYWTLGGTALLDTLGGTFERLGRDRWTAGLGVGIGGGPGEGCRGAARVCSSATVGRSHRTGMAPGPERRREPGPRPVRRGRGLRWRTRPGRCDHYVRARRRARPSLARVRLGPVVLTLGSGPRDRCLAPCASRAITIGMRTPPVGDCADRPGGGQGGAGGRSGSWVRWSGGLVIVGLWTKAV